MISFFLRNRAKKVLGVNATLRLKVGPFRDTIEFGRGNPAQPDYVEFNSISSLIKGVPDKCQGSGRAIIAFKEMMSG